jgi:hypothetical protein
MVSTAWSNDDRRMAFAASPVLRVGLGHGGQRQYEKPKVK